MIVQIPTDVIPVWYIEKWKKENAEPSSALDHFLEQLIKDWHVEEKLSYDRILTNLNGTC